MWVTVQLLVKLSRKGRFPSYTPGISDVASLCPLHVFPSQPENFKSRTYNPEGDFYYENHPMCVYQSMSVKRSLRFAAAGENSW